MKKRHRVKLEIALDDKDCTLSSTYLDKKFSKIRIGKSYLFGPNFAEGMTMLLYEAYKKDGIKYKAALCLSMGDLEKYSKRMLLSYEGFLFTINSDDDLYKLGTATTMESNPSGGVDWIKLFFLTDTQFKLFNALANREAEEYAKEKIPDVPIKPKWYKIWWVNYIVFPLFVLLLGAVLLA